MALHPSTGDPAVDSELKAFFAKRTDSSPEHQRSLRLILTEAELRVGVRRTARWIDKTFAGQDVIVVGMLKGAVWFMVDLTRELTIPYSVYFIDAASYHGMKQGSVEVQTVLNPSKFEGKVAIIVDDLFDNGLTLHIVKQKFADIGITNTHTVTLLSKDKSAEYPLPSFVGLPAMPNVWFVGNGMDDDTLRRGWVHVFGKRKPDGMVASATDAIFADDEFYRRVRADVVARVAVLRRELGE